LEVAHHHERFVTPKQKLFFDTTRKPAPGWRRCPREHLTNTTNSRRNSSDSLCLFIVFKLVEAIPLHVVTFHACPLDWLRHPSIKHAGFLSNEKRQIFEIDAHGNTEKTLSWSIALPGPRSLSKSSRKLLQRWPGKA